MTAPALKLRGLTCVRCGAAFECGSAAGACWCFDEDYRLPLPAADSGTDCLCPTCLRSHARALAEARARS